MDINVLKAELSATQAKLASIVDGAKAANRNLTSAEVAAIEKDADRAVQLKAQIVGLKNAGVMDQMRSGEEFEDNHGNVTRDLAAKGFMTLAGFKQAISAATPGIKSSLVTSGSTAIRTELAASPIQDGSTLAGLGLLGLLPTVVRDSPKYEYLVQDATNQDNNAAKVAAGAVKPTSVFGVKSVDNELDVFAHLTEYIDKYLLEDAAQLELFLSAQMSNGLLQAVTASGLADITAAASGSQAFVSTAADTIYEAITDVSVTGGGTASLVVVNPADYSAMRLSKETGTGAYLGGGPFDNGGNPSLWGVRTFVTPGQAAGSALVLDTSAVGVSTDGKGIRVDWDALTGFDKNEVRARFEGRWSFDTFLPARVVVADLTQA